MDTSKKYEFTGETLNHNGVTLNRIVAIRSFGNVKAGDVGGWIESERNLSHYGNAWVYGHAQVCDNARVYGHARVYDNAWVYDNAQVCDNARVYGHACVYGHAQVCDNARVYGNAVATRSVRTIRTALYYVTITDAHIRIGCQQKTISEWKKVTGKDVLLMDGEKSAKAWRKAKSFIMFLADGGDHE